MSQGYIALNQVGQIFIELDGEEEPAEEQNVCAVNSLGRIVTDDLQT